MPLTIPDDLLNSAGLTEAEARIEIACRLFEADKLGLWAAARWLGMSRVEFEQELLQRRIPLYKPSTEDLAADLDAMDRLGT